MGLGSAVIANDLSALSDEKICDGSYIKGDARKDFHKEVRERKIGFYCKNRRCLPTIEKLSEYLEWYEEKLKSKMNSMNSNLLRSGAFNPLHQFLSRCEDATLKYTE